MREISERVSEKDCVCVCVCMRLSERQCPDCDFASRLTSVRAVCVCVVDVLLMRMVLTACRTLTGGAG